MISLLLPHVHDDAFIFLSPSVLCLIIPSVLTFRPFILPSSVGNGCGSGLSAGWSSQTISSPLHGHSNSDVQRCLQVWPSSSFSVCCFSTKSFAMSLRDSQKWAFTLIKVSGVLIYLFSFFFFFFIKSEYSSLVLLHKSFLCLWLLFSMFTISSFCSIQEHGVGRALCFTQCWDTQKSGQILRCCNAPH